MQHIVRELKKAPTQVRQEYNRFKNVWQRYVLRTRQLQSLYEAFAVAALYGHDSDTCNVWLQKDAPALHARVNKMPDPAGNGDCGLSYMIEVMSLGLVDAAEDMAGEKVGGYFSTINMGPRAALALMSKKRGLEENDPSSVPMLLNKEAMEAYDNLARGVKKPRINDPIVPPFVFADERWAAPQEDQAHQDLQDRKVDEDVQAAEAKRDAADGDYKPASTGRKSNIGKNPPG